MMRILAVLCVLLPSAALGATDFVRSFPIAEDTFLEYAAGEADNSTALVIEMDAACETERAPFMLLWADTLAAGEIFDSATLVVYPNMSPSYGGTAYAYQVMGPITGGTGEISWKYRQLPDEWATWGCYSAGADIYPTPVATFDTWTGAADSVVICSGTAFSAFVADSVIGSSKWIVMHYSGTEEQAYCQWVSANDVTPPVLRIYGHTTDTPTGACCYADGTCSVVVEAGCTGTYQGNATDCDPNPCTQPSGACCYADGTCAVTTQAACTGIWQGMATDCDPNPCTQPQGACCYPDGTCAETTSAGCSGAYQGNGTSCDPNPCTQPDTGACCYGGGSCAITTDENCTGTWQGAGTDCDPNICPHDAYARRRLIMHR